MTFGSRAVTVMQFSEISSPEQRENFLCELKDRMTFDRPCIVLDCSELRELDKQDIHLLLCCLEEAMKRNGDVRLAGVSPEVRALLKFAGVDRLFRIFDRNVDAVSSYQRHPAGWAPHQTAHHDRYQAAENAA
jgi:anti-sigma B factor antagonist